MTSNDIHSGHTRKKPVLGLLDKLLGKIGLVRINESDELNGELLTRQLELLYFRTADIGLSTSSVCTAESIVDEALEDIKYAEDTYGR